MRHAMRRTLISPHFPFWARCLAWLLCTAAPCAAHAEDSHHIFWEVKGAHNTVYLLGSVHMLKPADSALSPEVLRAYQRSRALVMELDLNDTNAEALLGSALESATLPEGQTLAAALGPELYAAFSARAKSVELDPEVSAHLQPWFAALLLEQLSLARSGFDANAGIDMQFTQRALADGKPVIALETMAEQIGYFAQLTLDQQRQFLRSTLQELDGGEADTATLVRAWQHGDTAELERLLREESAQSPELLRVLTSVRNRRWLPKIAALLHDDHDDLVIVGAMHLIGRDGLVELLKGQGYSPVQH
jgi:uncharacterized protein YbaP (TraB family)